MAGSRKQGSGRVSTLGGLAMLAIPGFALGALAGVVWEDPGLVAAYLFGATEEVAWTPESGEGLPPVAAPPAVASPAPAQPAAPAPAAKSAAKPASAPPAAAAPSVQKPAAKQAPRVSPPVRTSRAGDVAIQVGAFSERAGADRLADELRGKGFPVLIVSGESSGAPRWRVRVGPIDSRDEAEKVAARLKREEKLPTWIVEDDG